MTSFCDCKFAKARGPRLGIEWSIFISLLVAAIAAPCRAQAPSQTALPKVLMIQRQGSTPSDEGLYQAIRAQLSASPLILDRIELDKEAWANPDVAPESAAPESAAPESAARAAEEKGAAMAFWIEDGDSCTMFFYLFDAKGGRFNTRSLDLDLSTGASRFEVIALVAADIIEGLLVSRADHPEPPPPFQERPKEPMPAEKRVRKTKPNRRFEISAAYAGSLFTANKTCHGILLGFGLLPINRLVLAASFAQNLPLRVESEEVELTIVSRQVEILAAGRILTGPVDVRAGLAWSADLRSVSAASVEETIRPRQDRFMGVYSLSPFVSAAWIYRERIGLFARIGVNLAVNETIYHLAYPDLGTTEILDPFIAKLTFQSGFVVKL